MFKKKPGQINKILSKNKKELSRGKHVKNRIEGELLCLKRKEDE